MKRVIFFLFIIFSLSTTSCTKVNAVKAVHVERKHVLTGEYEHVAASDISPKLVFRKLPKYPEKFINSGIEGKVKVFFVVNAEGTPVQVQYIEATDLAFAQEAITAVKEWRFEPALKNGVAVPACVVAPITISSK